MNDKKIKIAVIGTGMMGMSLAALFTGNGYDTTVLATCQNSIKRGHSNYQEIYHELLQRGLVNQKQIIKCEKNLHFALDYEELAHVDAIFECAIENCSEKHGIYKQIEYHCSNCKVIASTTSALSPESLCEGMNQYQNKLVVAHPFNPPHLVPFVEMVRSVYTSDDAAQMVYDILEDCGRKVSIMKKSAPGFLANRLQHALLREAIYMVEQGLADPREIDKALMYSFMPRYTSVGLFEHQDAAGLDMVQSIQEYLLPDLCDEKQVQKLVCESVAAGTLGQKSGQGIYEWDENAVNDFKSRAAEPYWKFFNWKLPNIQKE